MQSHWSEFSHLNATYTYFMTLRDQYCTAYANLTDPYRETTPSPVT